MKPSLKYCGYKEATVQKREMSFGHLRHIIAYKYLDHENMNITLLCLDDAEVRKVHSMKDILELEWSDYCNIEVINMPHRFGVIDCDGKMDDDAEYIIIFQLAEESSRVI